MVGQHRRDVKPGRQPCDRDPEDAELRMPCARQRIRNNLGDIVSVKFLSLDRIMGGDRTE